MTTTTMHFGPEWMRTKQAPSRMNPSPPLTTSASTGASSYSALVTPVSQAPPEKRDLVHPFRYSKEDLIRIYREGGGKGGLGLEVERWEGIVRELGADPISLKDMGEAEKKLFSGPLNSEMRRRPSTDYLSLSTPGLNERPKLNHSTTGPNSPLRERLGGYMGRKRDSTDQQPPLTLPRKLSQSSMQTIPLSPREALPSPRTRIPGTAGIDGVLSDSWHVRRKTSEGFLNSGNRSGEAVENQDSPQTTGIKEEEEEKGGAGQSDSGTVNGVNHTSQSDPPPENPQVGGREPAGGASAGMAKLSLNTQGTETNGNNVGPHTPVENAAAGPPPGIVDLSTVEWSYLDPQGHVQGPFPAATMQKWHEDGYFTPNLLMKRTHMDTEWMSVRDLAARAGNPRIFLTPLTNVPPGLPRRDPLLDGPAPDGTFGSPFQPIPARALRTATMDPYLHNSSLIPDSPSSTFSGGRFSNSSPDPATFANRLGGHHFNDSPVGPRLASLVGSSVEPQRRSTFDEHIDPTLVSRPSFGTYVPGRTASMDGLGFHAMDNAGPADAGPFSPASAQGHDGMFSNKSTFHATRVSQGSPMNNGQPTHGPNDLASTPGYREGPRLFGRDSFVDRPEAQQAFANGAVPYSSNGQPFGQGQLPFGSQLDNRSLHSFMPDRQPLTPLAQQRNLQQQPFVPSPTVSSPWPPQDPTTIRRPGPFDPEYPTSRNTVVAQPHRTITPSQSLTQIQVKPTTSTANGQSPWFASSQGAVSDGWTSDSLTAANLGHHNRQQEEQFRHHETQPTPIAESPVVEVPAAAQPQGSPEIPAAPAAEPDTLSAKRRRKPSVQAPAAPATQPVTPAKPAPTSTPVATVAKPPSPTPQPADVAKQPAWGTADDEKKKPPAAALGLREIQEIETKKIEARKAAERERERAARVVAAASPSTEEVQTLSWGLPTSQVGARTSTSVKESAVPQTSASPVVASTPVWTTAAKVPVVKKTMKEIQEEEEKRKKTAAKEKETVAAAARRAYAESTTKIVIPGQTGGAWTTVGASGKSSTPVTSPPVRPAVSTVAPAKAVPATPATPVLSAASVVSRAAASPTPTRSPVITTSVKLAPASSKVDEPPSAPSHDFLKWMTDSLKGLNNSVNLEEITSMLLSFPLDPDPSTVELISDLIYANSTTLDGRRFAAEFVSKRKVDSKGSAVAGKPLSIAEVVKTQPKPAQNEWGGFKVVNKKKKTGRS